MEPLPDTPPAGDTRPEAVDVADRLFRAALFGSRRELSPAPPDDAGERFFAPGRGRLELSVVCSAVTILIPLAAIGGVAFALAARRAQNPRWLAALVASIWCCLLGLVVRVAVRASFVP